MDPKQQKKNSEEVLLNSRNSYSGGASSSNGRLMVQVTLEEALGREKKFSVIGDYVSGNSVKRRKVSKAGRTMMQVSNGEAVMRKRKLSDGEGGNAVKKRKVSNDGSTMIQVSITVVGRKCKLSKDVDAEGGSAVKRRKVFTNSRTTMKVSKGDDSGRKNAVKRIGVFKDSRNRRQKAALFQREPRISDSPCLVDIPHLSCKEISKLKRCPVRVLGEGAYGTAFEVMYNGEVAVLKLAKSDVGSIKESFKKEASIMKDLEGTGGAPRLYAVCMKPSALVMEFCNGQTLWSLIFDQNWWWGSKIGTLDLLKLLPEVVAQMNRIHEKGIVHVDISPANIMVDIKGRRIPRVRIIDFGLAQPIGTVVEIPFDPRKWYPPEYSKGRKVSPAGDIYSVGCLLRLILNVRRHKCDALRQLQADMLHRNPAKRPTAEKVINTLKEELL